MNIEFYFFITGIVLVALGTGLSPSCAFLLHRISRRRAKSADIAPLTSMSLDILIPAHNELLSLPATIAAMKEVRARAHADFNGIRIVAGLSNWPGPEAHAAAEGADEVIEIAQPGKWRAIRQLVMNSRADWVALVDAGVIWETSLLATIQTALGDPATLAVNPRFQELQRGKLQKWIWTLESTLKKIENRSGGPISLHGATIFYRREQLRHALETLEGIDWLNDDVVLPLTMRRLYPQMNIVYAFDAIVTDRFPSWNASELKRRKRLLYGNIQWVQKVYLSMWFQQPVLAALATRRVARMMWAWWFIFLGLGVLFLTRTLWGDTAFAILLGAGVAGAIAILQTSSGRRLLEAFYISMVFPLYFVSYWLSGALPRWK